MNYGVKPVVVMEEYENGKGCATNSHEQENPMSECPPNLDKQKSQQLVMNYQKGLVLRVGVEESKSVSVGDPIIRSLEEPISSPCKKFPIAI